LDFLVKKFYGGMCTYMFQAKDSTHNSMDQQGTLLPSTTAWLDVGTAEHIACEHHQNSQTWTMAHEFSW
jgi:hypothetical protein